MLRIMNERQAVRLLQGNDCAMDSVSISSVHTKKHACNTHKGYALCHKLSAATNFPQANFNVDVTGRPVDERRCKCRGAG